MKQKVLKVFIDFEAEENWVNTMAARGWNLAAYSFPNYFFEKGEPGQYSYRLQLLDQLPSHPQSRAYIEFLEEMEVECVATHLRWAYFRKQAVDGPFELYSDRPSKIRHYQKIMAMMGVIAGANAVIGLGNLISGSGFNQGLSLLNFSIGAILAWVVYGYYQKTVLLREEQSLSE